MQCKCCFSDVTENVGICPVCGLPIASIGDGTAADSIITGYYNRLLSQIGIDLQIYNYEISGSGVADAGTAWMPIASGSQLQSGTVYWPALACRRIVSDRPFTMRFRMRNGTRQREQQVNFRPDHPVSREFVGILLREKLTFSVAVGTREAYILSEPIRLV